MSPDAGILVVDDTPHNVKLLKDILEVRGYRVVTAEDGEEALEALERHEIDLVLLDVVMPKLNGYDTCRAIRARPESAVLPVVLVTALSPDEERIKGIEAGADDFLTKPINQQELLARVKSLLRVKQLHDRVRHQSEELEELNRQLEQRVEEQTGEIVRLNQLRRFVSPQLARLIATDRQDSLLETHRREVSAVAVTLHGFAAFGESAEPEEVMDVLREYQAVMGDLVMSHDGTLESSGGPDLMIIFNDPIEIPDHIRCAVRMALAMRKHSSELRKGWARKGFELGQGIGIEVGFATLGLVGFAERWDYAAIGTVINRAAALSKEADPGRILITQKFAAQIENLVDVEPIGPRSLEGLSRPVKAFNILGLAGESVAPSAGLAPQDLSGQRLGRYRILEKIGEGGMGLVYVAEDLDLGRRVALKTVRSDIRLQTDSSRTVVEQNRLERFQREAKAVAALNHPNIVTIHSVEEESGLHYLTMEYVEGKTLSDAIPARGLLLRTFFEVAIPLSDAIRAAHDRGITHRDLKPTNVMLTPEGRVKVLDFGLAKFYDSGFEEMTLTTDGAAIGTYVYMSPEQLMGEEVDHRSDIFSLGILLFEMATGKRPFGGRSAAEMISSQLRDEPPSAHSIRDHLPRALDRILAHCLEKEPKRRFQTALDLRNELDSLRQEVSTGS